jgi:hypothetical protein
VVQRVAHHVLQNNLAAGVVVPVQCSLFVNHPERNGLAQVSTHRTYDASQARHQARHGYDPRRLDSRTQCRQRSRLLLHQGLRLIHMAVRQVDQIVEVFHRLTQDIGRFLELRVLVHLQSIQL